MNEPDALAAWLAEEVWELFQSGSVGLYEFIEFLNSELRPSAASTLSDQAKVSVARAALDNLLRRGGYELRWRTWTDDHDTPATATDITNDAWETPGEAPYLVIAEVSGNG